MTTRSMSNDVRTKTIIPDRSQPIPNKRFSRRKTTLRPCTFTRNWNDKAQSVDAVPSVSESQQPLYHSYRRETRSMSSTCSHEENVVDASPPEQTDRPTHDHNRQRKTRYSHNDNTGEDERIEDVQNDGSQSEDGVSEPATNGGQHHLSNLHQYDTGESQGNMSNASTWSRLRNANKPCKDISQVTCTRPSVPLVSSFQSAVWGAPEVNWTSDRHKSDVSVSDHASHPVSVDIPMLNINETGDASCRQPGDTSHCHPGDVSRHQSGDASYHQQGDTSSCHQPGDTSRGQPDDNPRDQPSDTPHFQPRDTPRGPLGDPSKLLSSLHRLGVDGRARLTGVHPTTPGKSSIRKPASAKPVSALSPRRASQMSTSRTRNRAITGARRAKGRQTKSSILVQQESHQTKQVDYAEEAKRLESEISENRAKMEDENSELLSLQDEHARLKAGAPTTRKSSNQTTGKKRLDSRSGQSGYELKEKRLKLGIFRTRSRIRKIKAETLSLQQELTGLKSDHAEQAFKRKEKSRSSQNVKQITKFLNKLEELQQTFSASKMTQSGAYEVFGSVLDVVRDKLPGTAKVISQLTAMEDNVRQSLA